MDEYCALIERVCCDCPSKAHPTQVRGYCVMFVGVLGISVEQKFIANIHVPDFYLGFFVLKMDHQVVFAL